MYPKTEEEIRQKVATTNNQYKDALKMASNAKLTYFQHHLPRLVRSLKQVNEDCDIELQKYMIKYSQCVEELMMNEATLVSPLDTHKQDGLVKIVNDIDWNNDLETYLANRLDTNSPVKDTVEPIYSGTPFHVANASSHTLVAKESKAMQQPALNQPRGQYFGSSLVQIMESDSEQTPVPRLVSNCIEYIEATGLKQEGLYRVTANASLVNRLRSILDVDPCFHLEEVVQDIHVVTSVLKMFFRELVEPLFPRDSYPALREAISTFLGCLF